MSRKHFIFHLGHPAHYQLFKNIIKALSFNGHQVSVLIKKKDILEILLVNDGLSYINLLPKGRSDTKLGIFIGMIKTDYKLFRFCLRNRPDLMIGTSYAISHVGKLLSIPSINVNEDDWDAVPFYSRFSYPWASVILTPTACSTGKWEDKTIKYSGYHELAYLHPNHFKPDLQIASKYVDINKPYSILRFASLRAHHDKDKHGINDEDSSELIEILRKWGNVYITSERAIPPLFEEYKLALNPIHIHHVMAFARLYIGDSQTMAAEAGILGIPFIRINDFVGRLGYLNELEQKYKLGSGFKPSDQSKILATIDNWLTNKNLKEEWQRKLAIMLQDKIDVTAFMVWFIENYPDSVKIMKEDHYYQNRFR